MPSTIGIVASHIRYTPPPTFSIVPAALTAYNGNTINWNITTTNFGSGTLFYSVNGQIGTSGTAFTDDIGTGSVSVVNDVGTLTKTLDRLALTTLNRSLYIRLHTAPLGTPGETVVAESATMTLIHPEFVGTTSNTSGTRSSGGTSTFTVTNGLVKDGRPHKFQLFRNGTTSAHATLKIDGVQILKSTSSTATTAYALVDASSVVTLEVYNDGSSATATSATLRVYPETYASFALSN